MQVFDYEKARDCIDYLFSIKLISFQRWMDMCLELQLFYENISNPA